MRPVWYSYVKYTPCGRPFYVGKGTGARAFGNHNHNRGYVRTHKKHGESNIRTVIIFWPSEREARASETTIITSFRVAGFKLENIHLNKGTPRLSRYNRINKNIKNPQPKKLSHLTEINRTLFKRFGMRLTIADTRGRKKDKFPRGFPKANPQFWRTKDIISWVEKQVYRGY